MRLIRILLVVIVGMLGWSVEGMQSQASVQTVFDLPTDTPGLLLNKQVKKVCGEDKECVHVVIGNERTYELVRSINENNSEVGFDAVAYDYQIYFPADGTQPTTEEAAEYSCANIDNTEGSPITEWYMRMFGWTNEEYFIIRAGFDNNQTSTPIFTFNQNMIKHRTDFWELFKKIATNPIGRALLYRILIEIRRNTNGQGCYASSSQRVFCRTEEIICDFFWRFVGNRIKYTDNVSCKFEITKDKYVVLANSQKQERYISLFHEMLHWFHYISDEFYYYKSEGHEQCHSFDEVLQNSIYQYYYKNIDGYNNRSRIATSLKGWAIDTFKINTEEFRTISGINFEISENAFRKSLGLPLRIFHIGKASMEEGLNDCKFIKKEDVHPRYCIEKTSCCGLQKGFICFGKEDDSIVDKLDEEATRCCQKHGVSVRMISRIDFEACNASNRSWRQGVGNAHF